MMTCLKALPTKLQNDTRFLPRQTTVEAISTRSSSEGPTLVRPLGFGFAALLLTGLALPAVADDWPQFRGPNRDGISNEKGIFSQLKRSKPTLAWIGSGVGDGYASVAVVGDFLYTTGNQSGSQMVSAMSIQDGTVAWSTPISTGVPQHGYEGSRSTPAVDGDRLYVVASNGAICCLNRETGEIVWKRDFQDWGGKMMSGWGFSESPLVDGNWVLCTPGGNSAVMVALDKRTGKEIWKTPLDQNPDGKDLNEGAGYASIVISNGGRVKQYVQLVGKGVIGVRASDGKLMWRYVGVANTTANIPTVIASGNNIFCSTGYDTGSALLELSPSGRNEVAAREVYFLPPKQLQNKQGGMVLVDGHIYCGQGNGNGLPICVNMKTGKVAWGPVRAPGSGESSVIYADGHVVFRFQDGRIAFVKASPRQFEVVQTLEPEYQERESWAYPVIANGKLYLREQDKVMCYQF